MEYKLKSGSSIVDELKRACIVIEFLGNEARTAQQNLISLSRGHFSRKKLLTTGPNRVRRPVRMYSLFQERPSSELPVFTMEGNIYARQMKISRHTPKKLEWNLKRLVSEYEVNVVKELLRDSRARLKVARMRLCEASLVKTRLFSISQDAVSSTRYDLYSWVKARIPNLARTNHIYKPTRVTKANKFLDNQFRRIRIALAEQRYDTAVLIWLLLLKTSKAYQVYLFNKVVPTWYWSMSRKRAEDELRNIMNKCARMDLTLEVRRFYILKKSGKWRPIGAPSLSSRAIAKALTAMLEAVLADREGDFQNGYRRHRGAYTAAMQIISYLKSRPWQKTEVFEFDFKSFFNTIRPIIVYEYLARISPNLAHIISVVLAKIVYRVDEIKEENELKYIGRSQEPGMPSKRVFTRWGLPQGLSLSPKLATMVMNASNIPAKLIMYADDGIIMGDDRNKMDEEIREWFTEIGWYGIKVAPEKTGWIESESFKLAGFEFNKLKKTVSFLDRDTGKPREISWYNPYLKDWLKKAASYYGKKKSPWTWKVEAESYVTYITLSLPWWRRIIYAILAICKGSYKGYVYNFGVGLTDTIGASSLCCEMLLWDTRLVSRRRRRRLEGSPELKFDIQHNKRGYIELIGENLYQLRITPGSMAWIKARSLPPGSLM